MWNWSFSATTEWNVLSNKKEISLLGSAATAEVETLISKQCPKEQMTRTSSKSSWGEEIFQIMSFHENEAILVTHTHYYSTTTTFKKCSQLLITLIPILVFVRVMRISRVVKYRLENRFLKSVWDGKCDVILINQVSLLSCPIFEFIFTTLKTSMTQGLDLSIEYSLLSLRKWNQ